MKNPRWILFAVGMAMLAGAISCAPPPLFHPSDWPELPGIKAGDSADQVLKVLGPPTGTVDGWWSDCYRFDMDYQIWLYKRTGRVIFDRWSHRVVQTQADPGQAGTTMGD